MFDDLLQEERIRHARRQALRHEERSNIRRFLQCWAVLCFIAGVPGFVLACLALLCGAILTVEFGTPPQFIDKALTLYCVFGVSVALIGVGVISCVLADMLPSQPVFWTDQPAR
jgi:hypothetical protein